MVARRLEAGQHQRDVAQAMCVSLTTLKKWLRRYRLEGSAGLLDRSSRPARSPHQLPPTVRLAITAMRQQRRTGRFIARELGVSGASVSREQYETERVDQRRMYCWLAQVTVSYALADSRSPFVRSSNVDCDRGLGIGHVHHAVVDDRLGLLAPIVVETDNSRRLSRLDCLLIDLLERTVAVLVVSHAVGEDVVGRAAIAVPALGDPTSARRSWAQQEDNACCRCNGLHK